MLSFNSATVTAVACSTEAVTLLPAISEPVPSMGVRPGTRVGFMLHNASAVTLYVKFGTGAAANSFTFPLLAGQTYESQALVPLGLVTGVLASSTGTVYVTECRL